MFQFTTTNVINTPYESNYIPTGNAEDEKKHLIWSASNDMLVLKRIGNFKKDEIRAIYKATPVAPAPACAKVDLSNLEGSDKKTARLNIYVGLSQGSNDPMYANDYYFKGKPYIIEFPIKKKASDTLDNLMKIIKKFDLGIQNEPMFTFEVDGTSLVIKAVNEYQRFHKLVLETLDEQAYHGMGNWEEVVDVMEKQVDSADALEKDSYFMGAEGFGTYDWILHNLRIPTCANSRFLSVHEDEAPVRGAKYVQYTIHQCANRGQLGLNAVGQEVTSTTTHVLFIKEDLAQSFQDTLSELGIEIQEGQKKAVEDSESLTD